MDRVKDVLQHVFSDLMKKEKRVGFAKIDEAWKRIVGPKAYLHTKIVYLTKDKIRVNVDNSSWLYDLNLKKEHIDKELYREFKIKDIKFKLGQVGEGYGRS